jgi:hypothetical protein
LFTVSVIPPFKVNLIALLIKLKIIYLILLGSETILILFSIKYSILM